MNDSVLTPFAGASRGAPTSEPVPSRTGWARKWLRRESNTTHETCYSDRLLVILFFFIAGTVQAQMPHHGPGGTPQDGPYMHEVWSASSPDGLTWTADGKRVLAHASVPAVIINETGDLMMYYVDGLQRPSSINCAESHDGGKTFTVQNCVIAGLPARVVPVDPSPFLLPDGRVRLYFFASHFGMFNNGGGSGTGPKFSGDPGSGPTTQVHSIGSAISTDGIHFTYEQEVFSYAGLVDPDVFFTGKDWLMYVCSLGQGTVIARSTDGLSFKYEGKMQPERWGTTAAVTLTAGKFRMYAFKQGEQRSISSFVSADGIHWTIEPGTRLLAPDSKEITDPYVVKLKDGTWKMFYKLSPEKPRPH